MLERAMDRVWFSGDAGPRLARAVLAPLGWGYGAAVAARNAAYDRGWLGSVPLALPAIAVGNLTVGGTGKTPVSAWIASRLRERGARPAIVLRGYGRDETLVHARLNPGVPVVADADRVRGVARARAAGATVAVLDDAFQHRRARRDADIVLLAADRSGVVRLLPAGPWREPLSALARATIVVVTRKAAPADRARETLERALREAPLARGAVVHLAPDALVCWPTGERRAGEALAGADVLAISAIGDPAAFEAQLRALGARIERAAFRDHHQFSGGDAAALARRASRATLAVCTLKDAVKLAALWPPSAPALWYLSQRVSVEVGRETLDALVADLASRTAPNGSTTPAPTGPPTDSHVP